MLARIKDKIRSSNFSKIIKPNKDDNFLPPNLYEFAELSADTYAERPLPEGWIKIYKADLPHGFGGSSYVKVNSLNQPTVIVFGIRGTVVPGNSTFDNIKDDILLAQKYAPLSLEQGLDFLEQSSKAFQVLFPNAVVDRVYTTGHSLGGYLSDLLAFVLWDLGATSFTFENPGTWEMVVQFLIDNGWEPDQITKIMSVLHDIYVVCQAGVNVINSCNTQLGNVYRLAHPDFNYGIPKISISPRYWLNLYYLLAYSILDQHRIEKICTYLKNNGTLILDSSYPSGFKAGYLAYLDGEVRKEYWDGYFMKAWWVDPYLRIIFSNDYDRYIQEMYKELALVRAAASEGFGLENVPCVETLENVGLFKPKREGVDSKSEEISQFEIDQFILIDNEPERASSTKNTDRCSIS